MTCSPEFVAAPDWTVAVRSVPSADWDEFVDRFPNRPVYMRSGWSALAREVFGHETFFIEARDNSGALLGTLPLVQQRGLLGNFITSIPFFNYGGTLAITGEIARALMARAREHAQTLGCSYLELRDTEVRDASWPIRNDKVTMLLDLPQSEEALAKQLGSKLRSQIKRADREAVLVRSGGAELVRDFYTVFAHNMHELGTPVYPVKFFDTIVRRFPNQVRIMVVARNGRPCAAGFLVIDRARAEIPWAACLAEAKPLGINMKLYWEALRASLVSGCTSFDFGRSTIDSGTYKFKKQWGAQPVPLHWHRWERRPSKQSSSDSRVLQVASSVWRRLPLRMANTLGPFVSPGLPW